MNHRSTWARAAAWLALCAIFGIMLAACGSKSGSASGAESSAVAGGKSAASAVTADPQFIAAKKLVQHCFAGTPVQQAHQIHLVFLSSKTGKNGPAVIAARTQLAACLGISKSDEQPFFNDAVTAAEHQKPRLSVLHPVAWLTAFFTGTLPPIVIKYSNAPGVGSGTTMSPSPSTTGASA